MSPRDTLRKALENAFPRAEISDQDLVEKENRILGRLRVEGSDFFSQLDDLERQDKLWRQLEELVDADSLLNFGPFVMEPVNPRDDRKAS